MSEAIQLGDAGSRPKAPRLEDIEYKFSDRAIAELETLKTHYPEWKACILPALWIAQREYGGFLPPNAIAEVAARLRRSYAEVEGVATFYTMYNTGHKPGKHKIEVCTCLSCHLCGAYAIWDYLRERLGVDNGQTTDDGMFTLEEVECLDACDRAPVLQIGDRYVGPVDKAAIDRLLTELRSTEQSTVVRLADEVVKTQIGKAEL